MPTYLIYKVIISFETDAIFNILFNLYLMPILSVVYLFINQFEYIKITYSRQ